MRKAATPPGTCRSRASRFAAPACRRPVPSPLAPAPTPGGEPLPPRSLHAELPRNRDRPPSTPDNLARDGAVRARHRLRARCLRQQARALLMRGAFFMVSAEFNEYRLRLVVTSGQSSDMDIGVPGTKESRSADAANIAERGTPPKKAQPGAREHEPPEVTVQPEVTQGGGSLWVRVRRRTSSAGSARAP